MAGKRGLFGTAKLGVKRPSKSLGRPKRGPGTRPKVGATKAKKKAGISTKRK